MSANTKDTPYSMDEGLPASENNMYHKVINIVPSKNVTVGWLISIL